MLDVDRPALIPLPSRLAGERVLVRPYRRGDGAALWAAVEASRAELARWLPWPARHQCLADSEQYVRWAAARWMTREDLTVAVTDHAGNLLGGSGLHGIDWRVRAAEIGYWLRTSAWGAGCASEAVRLLTALAFEHLGAPRVFIRCEAENERSRALAVRLGFPRALELSEERPAVGRSGHAVIVEYSLAVGDAEALPWYPRARATVALAPLDG